MNRRFLLPLLAVLALALPAQVLAVGTPAGTAIVNTASISYDIGATPVTQNSNTVTIAVGEILNLTLTWQDVPNVLVKPGATGQMLTFQLTNTGNYAETFNLGLDNTVAGDNFDPIGPTSIYLDSNGNSTYDAGVDTLHVAGTNDPTLAADGAITIFVFNAILGDPGGPADGATAISNLTATADTATIGDPAGTAYPGAGGAGTVAAVVGLSGATASVDGIYKVSRFDLLISKLQSVSDVFGGSQPLPGSTISYTINVVITGTGSGTNLIITDNIDADVVYATGTLRLGNDLASRVLLSDVADLDAGEVVAGVVTVDLGDINAPATRVVTFDVTIP